MTLNCLSIIICCYNSASRISETLRYIALQKVPDNLIWEVILVDNASVDDTAKIAQLEWDKYQVKEINFKIITEVQAGRVHALNTGIANAAFEYVLTCDDDNWLCESYVATACEVMNNDLKVGALGGYGLLEPEKPCWSEITNYQASYVTGQQYAKINKYVYGAGSVYRKSAIQALRGSNWTPLATGRTKGKLIGGEDIELCFAMHLNGYKIVNDDRLQFKHFVPLSRQNQDYLLRLDYWLSYSYVLLTGYVMLIDGDKRAISQRLNEWLVLTLKALTLFGFAASKQLITKRKKLNFDQRRKLNSYLGTLASLIQNKKRLISHKAHLDKLFPSVKN